MKSILNFFTDLFGHNVSQETVIAKNSILFISRNYKDNFYLTIVVAIVLTCLAVYLIKKYGGASEPLRKVPEWVPFNFSNNDVIFSYDVKNFLKSKTFTWVDIGKEYKQAFDEFGSTYQVLHYRFNHKDKTYRLVTDTRYSDGSKKICQTYKKESQSDKWAAIVEPELLEIYKYFLNFKQNF